MKSSSTFSLLGLLVSRTLYTSTLVSAEEATFGIQDSTQLFADLLADPLLSYNVHSIDSTNEEDIIYLIPKNAHTKHYDSLYRRAALNGEEDCPKNLGIKADSIHWKDATYPGKEFAQDLFSNRLYFPNVKSNVLDEVLGSQQEQLAMLAHDAYMEMIELDEYKKLQETNKHPTVMSAMAHGKYIYFSSSTRGDDTFVYKSVQNSSAPAFRIQNNHLRTHLSAIAEDSTTHKIHKFKGNCGECMITYQFFQENREETTYEGGIMASVSRADPNSLVETLSEPMVVNPCGLRITRQPSFEWGCGSLVQHAGGTYIHQGTPYASYSIHQKEGEKLERWKKSKRYHRWMRVQIAPHKHDGWVTGTTQP